MSTDFNEILGTSSLSKGAICYQITELTSSVSSWPLGSHHWLVVKAQLLLPIDTELAQCMLLLQDVN